MNVLVLGVNFKTAPVEVREGLSLAPEAVPPVLRRLKTRWPSVEIALLSTCNRTELYVAGRAELPDSAALKDALLQDLDVAAPAEACFYIESDLEAASHLLSVAAGLDSMVVGETEVLGQLKQAYRMAVDAETSGAVMTRLFPLAFRYAKRVHAETALAKGRVSVSSIAVEFAEKVFETLGEKTVLIVGAGETAELALKSLADRGVRDIIVLNRSLEKGRALADRFGGQSASLDELEDSLSRADIVISSTSARHCVIRADAVERAVRRRRGRPVLLVDIAVPRDIAPDAGQIENVYLYHIDDLQRVADSNLARRRDAVAGARAILREGMAEVASTFGGPDIDGLMKRLDRRARDIQESEINRSFAKDKMRDLPDACREEVSLLVHRTINKLLAHPRRALRKAGENGEWEDYARIARELFGFDEDKEG